MRPILLSATLLLGLASSLSAAPALGAKPPKWEYAELTYRALPARGGGVDADGNVVAAIPASVSIRWVTGAGEVDVKGWEELAEKLKAPALKKGTVAYTKIQILNFLGGEGWELMEQQGSAASAARGPRDPLVGPGERVPFGPSPTSAWLLKRRVP